MIGYLVLGVFAGVLAPGEEQGDRVSVAGGHDAGSENPRPFRFVRRRLLGGLHPGRVGGPFSHQGEDFHGRVVVIDHLALSGLANQGSRLIVENHVTQQPNDQQEMKPTLIYLQNP